MGFRMGKQGTKNLRRSGGPRHGESSKANIFFRCMSFSFAMMS